MLKKYRTVLISVAATSALILGIQFLFFGGSLKSLLKINQVMNLLEDRFYYDIDEQTLTDYALTGMAVATNDPYTNYYSAEQYGGYLQSGENSYIGIGVVIGATEDNKNLQVISAMESSPGEAAGVKSGDIILKVDNEPVTADDLNEVADKLKGNSENIGDSILLTVMRDSETLEIEVKKDVIEKDTVKSRMLSDSIGYIRISSFDRHDSNNEDSSDTFDEFKYEIDNMAVEGIKKLVLDLRDNPGGDLKIVSKIADYLLPEGIITYTEDKYGKQEYIYSDENYIDMEIVVLVNGGSASSSEILTGALKDHDRAVIVGTKTYGKGIVQTIFSLSDGSGISITTSKYYTPNGVSIHEIGIEPDYNIELPEDITKASSLLTYEEDIQLQKAVELLND